MNDDLCINTLKRAGFPECAAHVEKLVERLECDGIHSCHQDCQRTACVLRREVEFLKEAIRSTIENNLHLADGDDCTLRTLKEAINYELPADL